MDYNYDVRFRRSRLGRELYFSTGSFFSILLKTFLDYSIYEIWSKTFLSFFTQAHAYDQYKIRFPFFENMTASYLDAMLMNEFRETQTAHMTIFAFFGKG